MYWRGPAIMRSLDQVLKCKASNQILVLQVLCYKDLHCSRAQVYTILANFNKSICTEILHLTTTTNLLEFILYSKRLNMEKNCL
jgi:hypothetical protein